jgi:hypothetical protein
LKNQALKLQQGPPRSKCSFSAGFMHILPCFGVPSYSLVSSRVQIRIFCSLRPSLKLVSKGTIIFSHAYASIKEAGSSDTQALERALETLEKNFHDNLQIRTTLDSAMQALLP